MRRWPTFIERYGNPKKIAVKRCLGALRRNGCCEPRRSVVDPHHSNSSHPYQCRPILSLSTGIAVGAKKMPVHSLSSPLPECRREDGGQNESGKDQNRTMSCSTYNGGVSSPAQGIQECLLVQFMTRSTKGDHWNNQLVTEGSRVPHLYFRAFRQGNDINLSVSPGIIFVALYGMEASHYNRGKDDTGTSTELAATYVSQRRRR